MAAINMGSSYSDNSDANLSDGKFVMMDPFSGPMGSPFDADGGASTTVAQAGTNTGNGTFSTVVISASTLTEDWTVECTDDAVSGSEVWSVTGTVSGLQTATATTGVAYASDNSEIAFTITDGATDFVVGDTWTFSTTAANPPSTGAVCTGIGFGSLPVVGSGGITAAGYTDDYTPGVTLPSGSAATTAILTTIAGGKSNAVVDGECVTNPYNVQPLLGFGSGVGRDAGSGPAFTGHAVKMVTATGTVANNGTVETGFTNRSGGTITAGQSVFGSKTAASSAVT